MSNRIITRHGTVTPQSGDLEPYELGILYDGDNYSLYCGDASGEPVQLGGEDVYNYNSLSNRPTINNVTLVSGLTMASFGNVTLGGTLTVPSTLTVQGAVTISGNMAVYGTTTISSNMTVQGASYLKGVTYVDYENSSGNVPLYFRATSDNGSKYNVGCINNIKGTNTWRMYFYERSVSSSGVMTSYYEKYRLPISNIGLTSDAYYEVLTTKTYAPPAVITGTTAPSSISTSGWSTGTLYVYYGS